MLGPPGTMVSLSSVGINFLTTLRTTFTTFFWVRSWLSVKHGWWSPVPTDLILPLAQSLTPLPIMVPFTSMSLWCTGFGLNGTLRVSGFEKHPNTFDVCSGLMKRTGTCTGL